MCHLFLLLPIFALPVFWLLPIGAASLLYAAVLVASVAVYWLAIKAMRAPVVVGIETLNRAVGVVRQVDGRKATIWTRSELWSVESEHGALKVGDAVEVVGIKGIVLRVKRVEPGLPHPGSSASSPPARMRFDGTFTTRRDLLP